MHMSTPETRFRVARVPLAQIVDPSTRRVSMRWLMEYWRQLTAPEHARHDAEALLLTPRADGRYTIEDGRHRYYASQLAGRVDVVGLILYAPGAPGYDTCPPIEGQIEGQEEVA